MSGLCIIIQLLYYSYLILNQNPLNASLCTPVTTPPLQVVASQIHNKLTVKPLLIVLKEFFLLRRELHKSTVR